MFYTDGLPIAVSSFQVKHIVVMERQRELVEHKGVYKYMIVENYFVDSILHHYNNPIHCLCRHSIKESDVDQFVGTLKDRKMTSFLDTQATPPIHECYAILALHTGKERLKKFFS